MYMRIDAKKTRRVVMQPCLIKLVTRSDGGERKRVSDIGGGKRKASFKKIQSKIEKERKEKKRKEKMTLRSTGDL